LAPTQVAALARGGITTDVSVQPGHWSLLGGTEGGLAMQRTLGLLGVERSGLAELDRLALSAASSEVEVSGIGAGALALGNIVDGTGPGHVWRAVVEAATAQAVRLHEEMTAVAGPHTTLVAAGGWCNSRMVVHAKRAGFGELTVAAVPEAGTLGAATLAARAAGWLGQHDTLGVPG
jgi:sugar (pentulose or hexulose) kinase